MSNRVVPHKQTIHEQLRVEQVSNAVLVLVAPLVVIGSLVWEWPSERGAFAAIYIGLLAVEYVLVLFAVWHVISVRQIKFGQRDDDRLLFTFIAVTIFLATVLLAEIMLLGLSIATMGLGIYNICIAQRKILDLKLASDETDMST